MVLSTNLRLEMQTGIKDKMQNKSCTLRSISHQKEALYLYRIKFRSTGLQLDYSPEGGLISLPDRPYLERQYADKISANPILNSRKAKANIFFIFYYFILYIRLLFRGVIWHIVSLKLE